MKKSFSYNLTQFGGADNTVTEQIKTSDGVKTITTDANTGAVILSDQVDEDSLNPVTGAAVATAIAQGGGGVPEYGESDAGKVLQVDAQGDELVWAVAGGAYTAGNGIDIQNDEISVKVDGTTIQVNTSGELEAIGGGGGGGGVPTPTAGDANKLLGVNYLGTGYTIVSRELPNKSNVYDKVLHLDGDGDLEWADFGSPLYMVDFTISNGSITCYIPESAGAVFWYDETFMWWIHMERFGGSGSFPFNNLSTLKVTGYSTEYEMSIGGMGLGQSVNGWGNLSLSGTGSLNTASGWYDRTMTFTFYDDSNNNITSSLASLQGLQGKFIYKFPLKRNVP